MRDNNYDSDTDEQGDINLPDVCDKSDDSD